MIGAIPTHVRLGEANRIARAAMLLGVALLGRRLGAPVNDGGGLVSMTAPELLWPATDDPAEIERIPLEDRGLPESTYHALVRAAELWPERPAISCLPDAERWERPATRTFAELADDVHRAASVYAGLGVGRRDAVAILSVNCSEMITAVLAAEAVGIAAPVNPALAAGHAAELVRLSGAKVIVAAGPELDGRSGRWPGGSPPRPAPARSSRCGRPRREGRRRSSSRWRGATVAYLGALAREAPADGSRRGAAADDLASYLHTGGTTGTRSSRRARTPTRSPTPG